MRLSTLAKASFKIHHRNLSCHNCRKPLQENELYISGCSLSKTTGYNGGYWCLNCYSLSNTSSYVERMIEMAKEDVKQLGVPMVTDFAKAMAEVQEWDIEQGSLLNETFIIKDFLTIEAYDNEALLVKAIVNDEPKAVLINSVVLMKQLKRVQKYLPIKVTIKKIKNYYSFA